MSADGCRFGVLSQPLAGETTTTISQKANHQSISQSVSQSVSGAAIITMAYCDARNVWEMLYAMMTNRDGKITLPPSVDPPVAGAMRFMRQIATFGIIRILFEN